MALPTSEATTGLTWELRADEPTGNVVKDSLPYRYAAALVRMGAAMFRRT
jgi:hypothetical protein